MRDPFADLVVGLADEQATGLLVLDASGVITHVYFRQGRPVFVSRGSLGDTLGRLLVRTGRISGDEYSLAIERLTQSLVANEEMRLGEILVELGFLTADEITSALDEQCHRKLLACFQWEEVDWEFKEGEDELAGIQTVLDEEARGLVLEGFRQYLDQDRIESHLGAHYDDFPVLVGAPADVAAAYRLKANESKLVASIDGKRTLATVQQASALDRIRAGQLLAALLVGGSLDLHQGAAPPAPALTPPQPEVAFKPKNRGLTSHRRREPIVADDPTAPPEKLKAEAACQRGKKALQKGNFEEALRAFDEACELFPAATEYQAFREWTSYRREVRLAAQKLGASALGAARLLLEQESASAIGHLIVGHFKVLEGDAAGGRRHLQRAAEADPGDPEVQRALREIGT